MFPIWYPARIFGPCLTGMGVSRVQKIDCPLVVSLLVLFLPKKINAIINQWISWFCLVQYTWNIVPSVVCKSMAPDMTSHQHTVAFFSFFFFLFSFFFFLCSLSPIITHHPQTLTNRGIFRKWLPFPDLIQLTTAIKTNAPLKAIIPKAATAANQKIDMAKLWPISVGFGLNFFSSCMRLARLWLSEEKENRAILRLKRLFQ